MQLAATSKPTPLPVMPTTGPADWEGVPLATMSWKSNFADQAVFASTDGFTKLDGVDSVEGALAAATRLSYERSATTPTAAAVLQAKDGAFYVTALTRRGEAANKSFYFPRTPDGVRVESITPHVDALRAVVGGTSWVRFDAKPGDVPKAVPVES